MTQEEHTELNEAAADMEENGYSEEHKRRSVKLVSKWYSKFITHLLF